MTAPVAPQAPVPEQQAQVPAPGQPDPAAAAPAPDAGGDEDSERAKIWPPPPEQLLEFMMGARFSIIEEPGGEATSIETADPSAAPSPGTTPPAPAQPAPPQQAPVKE